MSSEVPNSSGATETFVRRFAAVWANPDPARFATLWHDDGFLDHPGLAPIPAASIPDYVERLLAAIPTLRLQVTDWAASGASVFIAWSLTATVEGHPVELPGVDRFSLRDDRAVAGRAFFDPTALLPAFRGSSPAPVA